MQDIPSTGWHTVVTYNTIALDQVPPARHRRASLRCSALYPTLQELIMVEALGLSELRHLWDKRLSHLVYGSQGWRSRQCTLWEVLMYGPPSTLWWPSDCSPDSSHNKVHLKHLYILFSYSNCGHLEKHKASDLFVCLAGFCFKLSSEFQNPSEENGNHHLELFGSNPNGETRVF